MANPKAINAVLKRDVGVLVTPDRTDPVVSAIAPPRGNPNICKAEEEEEVERLDFGNANEDVVVVVVGCFLAMMCCRTLTVCVAKAVTA